ncbi:hypothetical protein N0V93_000923 [Gnomoniopsis smithogilvyi]|uniref:Acyltransferase 3 domain-containing protein n=1 Tax=Gnomoniopsis smithogilvyi TaxID=1191159 RepID=A0A9W8Z4Y3_9PEZI|nr:hypothetical protein N0V93_000923 [Gnomoniopsis smithogilvyi]
MSSFWNGSTSTPKNGDQPLDYLPQHKDEDSGRRDGHESSTSTAKPTAKIKALDGLRGIACFLVFNYHFLWPWTPLIMLGYGARPPKSPEPLDGSFWQLPIICLLHRGRPMVAIFFAISGYVLCRHIQREIHARRFGDAYAKLTSGVFRRIWRLYIPCTVSMFAVALLAQVGVFRSEKSIFKGPDSVWINGTVTKGFFANGTCPNNTVAAEGRLGVAELLGLRTEVYLNETIKDTDQVCLNMTSKLHMPATLYLDVDKPKKNKTAPANTTTSKVFTDFAEYHHSDTHNPASKANAKPADLTGSNNVTQNFTWIQLGGSWEEHPIIHPHIFKALANFTVVYSEWVNPFQFGHMHPRYDPHTWTIPKELRGSMVIYTFLLGTAALKARWRLTAAAGLSAYAITMGFWDMGVFVGGMLLSELDLLRTTEPSALSNEDRLFVATLFSGARRNALPTTTGRIIRWSTIFVAFYLLSYPDAAAEFTPGFRTLSALVPRWYIPVSKWMFYQAIGALLLLPCVLRSPTLRGLLESPIPQYLGRISFSFYLVHGPVLHSLGFWVMPRLFERLGKVGGYVVGYVGLLSVALWHALRIMTARRNFDWQTNPSKALIEF